MCVSTTNLLFSFLFVSWSSGSSSSISGRAGETITHSSLFYVHVRWLFHNTVDSSSSSSSLKTPCISFEFAPFRQQCSMHTLPSERLILLRQLSLCHLMFMVVWDSFALSLSLFYVLQWSIQGQCHSRHPLLQRRRRRRSWQRQQLLIFIIKTCLT